MCNVHDNPSKQGFDISGREKRCDGDLSGGAEDKSYGVCLVQQANGYSVILIMKLLELKKKKHFN